MRIQLKERLPGDDQLNAQQIEKLLERKQAEAAKYAAEPDRFTLFSLEVEVRGDHRNHLVQYNEGDWSCTCSFFQDWGTCSHTRAVALRLKDSLSVEGGL